MGCQQSAPGPPPVIEHCDESAACPSTPPPSPTPRPTEVEPVRLASARLDPITGYDLGTTEVVDCWYPQNSGPTDRLIADENGFVHRYPNDWFEAIRDGRTTQLPSSYLRRLRITEAGFEVVGLPREAGLLSLGFFYVYVEEQVAADMSSRAGWAPVEVRSFSDQEVELIVPSLYSKRTQGYRLTISSAVALTLLDGRVDPGAVRAGEIMRRGSVTTRTDMHQAWPFSGVDGVPIRGRLRSITAGSKRDPSILDRTPLAPPQTIDRLTGDRIAEVRLEKLDRTPIWIIDRVRRRYQPALHVETRGDSMTLILGQPFRLVERAIDDRVATPPAVAAAIVDSWQSMASEQMTLNYNRRVFLFLQHDLLPDGFLEAFTLVEGWVEVRVTAGDAKTVEFELQLPGLDELPRERFDRVNLAIHLTVRRPTELWATDELQPPTPPIPEC